VAEETREKKIVPNTLLKQARERKHLTQGQVAEALGTTEQTVGNWERGINPPSLVYRRPLCELLSATPEQLGLPVGEAHENCAEFAEASLPPATSTVHLADSLPPERGIDRKVPAAHLAHFTHQGDASLVRSIPFRSLLSHRDKNRQRMLNKVRAFWIEGLFQHTVPQDAFITLNLVEQPDALLNPWQFEVQETNLPAKALPPGTSILQVYDEAQGELLILGKPGGGKSTLLQELARHLLDRAEQDTDYPIPVILNLSSWGEKRQMSLADWLVEALHVKYQVPRAVGQTWVETDQLLLLLDGLDEVAQAQRPACVDAINRYHEEHVLVSIVVCSREEEYQAQAKRLALQCAVVVQPLTMEQIDAYISNVGEALQAVREVLPESPVLQELVTTPLMLSVLHGASAEDLPKAGSPQNQQAQVFAAYVQRVLTRRSAHHGYTPEQTKRWLAWIARQLAQHNQSEFYLERMQPDWLPGSRLRHCYMRTMIRLIFGIQILISAGLFAWLRGGKLGNIVGVSVGLLGRLGAKSGNTILGWMAPGLGGGLEGGGSLGVLFALVSVLVVLLIEHGESLTITNQAIWHGLSRGVQAGLSIGGIVGIFSSLIFSLSDGPANGWYRGLSAGLFSGLLMGLMAGLLAGLSPSVQRVQRIKPDDEETNILRARPLDRLFDIITFSACAFISNGGVYALLIGHLTLNVIVYGLIISFFYGVAFGLGGGTNLIQGLGIEITPAETVAWSWQAIGQAFPSLLRKGMIVGLFVMGCGVVTLGCAGGLFYGARYGFHYGLVYGAILGLVSAVASILTGMLKSGWSSQVLAEKQLTRPNEGTRRSLRNAGFAACLFGPLGGIFGGLVCGLSFGLIGGLAGWPILGGGFALVFGVIFALQFLMLQGGIASLQHYVLRWYLWRAGVMPWCYTAFLDYAAERILLRKVGGGYIFYHRLLLDYFAGLDTRAIPGGKAMQSHTHTDTKSASDDAA
jgi:transcriptional regulator with XRE-family HTH domain/energy-coupling factor transporter ATP-binding protein EcfA2